MPDEAKAIAAFFRRVTRQRPEPLDAEWREVRKLVMRAIKRQEQRQFREAPRTVFARLVVELTEPKSLDESMEVVRFECKEQK